MASSHTSEAAGPTLCSPSTVLYVWGRLAFFSQSCPFHSSTWKKILPQPPALVHPRKQSSKTPSLGSRGRRTVLSRKLLVPVKWATCLHPQVFQGDPSHLTSPTESSTETQASQLITQTVIPMRVSAVCSVPQSCLPLCNPQDYSLSGSFVQGIFQARILEQVAISYSNRSSQLRVIPTVFCMLLFVVQRLSHVQFFVTPWAAACQASLPLTISHSLSKFIH